VNRSETRQVLADHADGITSPGHFRNQQVQGLLDLAEQLQGILVPVAPSTDFRRRLHGELILEAQRRESEPEPSIFRQHRRGILIGAAALGSAASVVGVIIAFLLRHRRGGATHLAAG
jgi:hypothetical protein